MLLRQVQARPLQGHHLRALRRRGDAPEGSPRADGPHRPRGPGLAHLVLQGRPEPHRLPARHRSARAREGPLLRGLDRHAGRSGEAPGGPRRPRGQGRGRERARLPRSRRGARRARRSPRPQAGLLRRRQGEELRRGRRLLGPWPLELGRGVGAAHARRGARARKRRVRAAGEVDHDRGSAARPRARATDGDPRGPPARSARGRVGRGGGRPDRVGARPAPQRARQGDGLEEGRDHEAPEEDPGGAPRPARSMSEEDAALVAGVEKKNLEKAREVGIGAPRRRARHGRSRRGRGGRARARVRPLPRRGDEEGGPRRHRPVGAEGPRDGRGHRDAPGGHPRGRGRGRAPPRADVAPLQGARARR